MPRRNNPDPLEDMRRKLAEQERAIAEKMARISQGLDPDGPVETKPPEPPVWRLEEEGTAERPAELTPARKRHLARQRQRDRLLFFVTLGVLLVVLTIVAWVAYVHNAGPSTGP